VKGCQRGGRATIPQKLAERSRRVRDVKRIASGEGHRESRKSASIKGKTSAGPLQARNPSGGKFGYEGPSVLLIPGFGAKLSKTGGEALACVHLKRNDKESKKGLKKKAKINPQTKRVGTSLWHI